MSEDEDSDNMCAICYEELDPKSTQVLKCGHRFHTECIKQAYITQKGFSRTCPFCRKYGGYLELEPSTLPIKNIHKEYKNFKMIEKNKDYEKLKEYVDNSKCFSILKTGKNKGKQCSFKKIPNGYLCKKHEKLVSGP